MWKHEQAATSRDIIIIIMESKLKLKNITEKISKNRTKRHETMQNVNIYTHNVRTENIDTVIGQSLSIGHGHFNKQHNRKGKNDINAFPMTSVEIEDCYIYSQIHRAYTKRLSGSADLEKQKIV